MEDLQLCQNIKRFVVQASISGSSLRKQGAPGVVGAARDFCLEMNIQNFVTETTEEFQDELDRQTETLQSSFPNGAQNWGAARKAINIVLRECLYNKYLCLSYRFERVESWLEIPLDQDVAEGINNDYPEGQLTIWPGVKYLNDIVSDEYQRAASFVAKNIYNVSRVHLDTVYWRGSR